MDETDVDSYFYHNILVIALIHVEMFELAKVPTKKFCFQTISVLQLEKSTKKRFILEEEVSISLKELAAFLNTLRQFLKQYDKAVKFPALPKPKQEIGFTLFKDELFAHYFFAYFYQDQSIVQLIGDVICPNKKCRGEKCVYLTSFEEINKSTYQCKQCKACNHVLNFPFKDQKSCVTFFGWTYCFRKKTNSDYQKEKLSRLMRQYIRQSKLSTAKAEEANIEPFPKKAKILPYVE